MEFHRVRPRRGMMEEARHDEASHHDVEGETGMAGLPLRPWARIRTEIDPRGGVAGGH
jgi:hypothetical protein